MNASTINEYLISDVNIKRIYRGVISSNELYKICKNNECLYVVNTDPNYLPGSHWIVIYSSNKSCEIFDSLGENPLSYGTHFTNFLFNYNKYSYCIKQLQNKMSNTCGIFCIFYIFWKTRGFDLNEIVNTFSHDTVLNEYLMRKFMIEFNMHIQNSHVYSKSLAK